MRGASWLLATHTLVWLSMGAAPSAGAGSQLPSINESAPAAEAPLPVLPAALAAAVSQLQSAVTFALGAATDVELLKRVQPYASAILEARSEFQGDGWWETTDARIQAELVDRLLSGSDEVRRALAPILARSAGTRPRSPDGVVAVRAQFDVCSQLLEGTHPTCLWIQTRLANLLAAQGEIDDAEALERRIVEVRERFLGDSHPDLGSALLNLSVSLMETGRLKEAESLRRRALDVYRRTVGADSALVADAEVDLGECLLALGRPRDAELLLRQALAARRRLRGANDASTAAAANSLGIALYNLGRFSDAEVLFRDALAVRRQLLGAGHEDTLRSLELMGSALSSLGRLAEAARVQREALSACRDSLGAESLRCASILNSLAATTANLGRLGEAETMHRDSYAVRRRALGARHRYTAESLNDLGLTIAMLGRSAEAEPMLREALAIRRDVLGKDHPNVYASASQLAEVLNALSRHTEAEVLLRESLAWFRGNLGSDHPFYPYAAGQLANTLLMLDRPTDAEQVSREALAASRRVFGEEHPAYAEALQGLGMALIACGRGSDAEAYLRTALEIRTRTLGASHPDTGGSARNLASLLSASGKRVESESRYRQALVAIRDSSGEGHPGYASAAVGLGKLLASGGNTAEASELLSLALQKRARRMTEFVRWLPSDEVQRLRSAEPADEFDWLLSATFDGVPKGGGRGWDGTVAWKHLLAEIRRQEQTRWLEAAEVAPSDWRERWTELLNRRRVYASLVVNRMGIPSLPGMPSVDVGALGRAIEEEEAALRRDNPAYARLARLDEVSPADVRSALRPGQMLVDYVKYTPVDFATGEAREDRYGAFVVRGGEPDETGVTAVDLGEAEAIDAAVASLRTAIQDTVTNLEEVRALSPDAATSAALWRESMAHPGAMSETRVAQAAATLRRAVWDPLVKHLGTPARVYVAPDGPLALVPFEVLAERGPAGWHYLIEETELVTLSSARDLGRLSLAASTPSTGAPVLVGNPRFDATRSQLAAAVLSSRVEQSPVGLGTGSPAPTVMGSAGPFEPLEATASLLRSVAGWFPASYGRPVKLSGTGAAEEAVARVARPRVLQFLTHGGYRTAIDAPALAPELRSFLALSGANTAWQAAPAVAYRVGEQILPEDAPAVARLSPAERAAARVETPLADGLLTAYEVSGMDLTGTELVNLTACETGVGDVTVDGVVGLRQSFLFAGARSVTASVWPVPLTETLRQMRGFYRGWLAPGGDRPALTRYAAFRAAQLEALKYARRVYKRGHPFFWAGTVYVGDPGDLPVQPLPQ